MSALSWVRLGRRLPGVVRQQELPSLEALIDAEAGRQPAYNLFILSCAIPAGIGVFGGLSVFFAWVAGNTGTPLILGTALTAVLAAGAWFTFYRLYQAVPPSRRHLRSLILKFSSRYSSFGNIVLGEQTLSEPYAALLDEAATIYLRHCSDTSNATDKAIEAIEEAMTRLMETAVQKNPEAQNQALTWAEPTLEAMRQLDKTLAEHALTAGKELIADPLAKLRDARAELETNTHAIKELDQHIGAP